MTLSSGEMPSSSILFWPPMVKAAACKINQKPKTRSDFIKSEDDFLLAFLSILDDFFCFRDFNTFQVILKLFMIFTNSFGIPVALQRIP